MEIALDHSGTHALQSLIEVDILNFEENQKNCEYLFNTILNDDNLRKLCHNINGTHVVQKIVLCFDEEIRSTIDNFILKEFTSLCMNPNGICLVRIFVN